MNRGLLGLDWQLIIPTLILVILGLVTLFSLNINFFKGQFFLFLFSVLFFFIFSQSNFKIFKNYSLAIYVGSVILLLGVLIIGIESRGSVRWVDIFGIRVQFSEILKPFLALSFAGFIFKIKDYSYKNFLQIFIYLLPIFLLIFFQPDLGNALIYALVVVITLVYVGFPISYFIISAIPFILMSPVLWNLLHDYQRQRVLTFINPTADPLGKSYNIIQSIIAVGSGMIIGKGIGQGTQSGLRFLPERQTDFIFATISEQLGLVGIIIIFVCFAFLLYRIYIIFLNTEDKFSQSFCAIVFFTLLIQFFVNVGMNLGILPIVGVTLPFVSYGGSSLLSNLIFLGIINSISNSIKNEKVIEIR